MLPGFLLALLSGSVVDGPYGTGAITGAHVDIGVAEFSGSGANCLPVSLSTMLTDTSMNSSSDGMSSSLKRRRLGSSAKLVAEMRSNTDLVCVGDEHIQSASTDAMILSHLQWGVTWPAIRFLFNRSRRSGSGDAE